MDEFLGENEGLLIAEIVLIHENELFEKPLDEKRSNRRSGLLQCNAV